MYMNKAAYFQFLRIVTVSGLVMIPSLAKAQDMSGDMGFSLDLNAPAGDSGGFAIDLGSAPSSDAGNSGGISIDLGSGTMDAGSDGGFVIDLGDSGDFSIGEIDLDFGSGEEGDGLDFGSIDMSSISEIKSVEREQYEEALKLMRNERWELAAAKFFHILNDDAYKEFYFESEYQLAKALYKMNLFHPSLERFKVILNKGPEHPRYKTSIEWVFFISRKIADQSEVLRELAKFRKVTWPKQYRNEYRFLLAKYLFSQAQIFEIQRIKDEEAAKRNKKRQKSFDFKEFEEQQSEDDWGETFVISTDDDDEDNSFDFGEIDLSDGMVFDIETEGQMRAETAPLPTTAKEAIDLALELLSKISDKSQFNAQARYLEGLLHYLSGSRMDIETSVKSFVQVVRILDPRKAKKTDPVLREAAFLTLARIHYEFRQFDRSVFYYDRINRDSDAWLTSLLESSWAYYQRGDFEKALGNLVTLHSPFFNDEYFPESQILRAVIYYENCRFPETREIVENFMKDARPVLKYLQSYVKDKPDPEKLYEQIDMMLKSKRRRTTDELANKVMRLVTMDQDVVTAREKVAEIDKQIAILDKKSDDFKSTNMYAQLIEELTSLRKVRMREGGQLLTERFNKEINALKSLLSQALSIRIEVNKREREIIRQKMLGEDAGVTQRAYEASVVVDDEHLYWPYDEEYWRDELGTYEYTLSWGCK